MINALAQELNQTLAGSVVDSLFSKMGERLYFPNGIISQGGEAAKDATFANGTIGMAVVNGTPIELDSYKKSMPNFNAREAVAYAKTGGNPELRKIWKEQIISKNPLLKGKTFSLPILVPGLTAALSYVCDLFVDETKPMISAEPCWDNYELIAAARCNAEFHRFKCFENGKFNISGLEEKMKADAQKYGSVRVILNFPQNPSGYSPTKNEVLEICRIVKEIAESGKKVLVLSDDAYFGLDYEDDIEPQSLFAYLCDIHENVLAIKADGPTKEDFAWGFRTGFITFASKSLSEAQYTALTTKFMSAIRSSVSCSATPSQSIIMHALNDQAHEEQKKELRAMLKRRYDLVRKFVNTHKSSVLEPLPFNSGYFMSFHVNTGKAEEIRKRLLAVDCIGVIQIDPYTLRVAFSSIDEDKIDLVYASIYNEAETTK
ncbi:aminotransferase class I/II-fold pyridoxal phosphate-dependent enzyme [Treponema sp. Marseille-Q3903]|uniref:aminotransferase class I/II-fold pyridoxal phosphate-dependent enzyme n=1 Tax=Treponema sp. Marseille-Q3903 TaxID=2766703 RepID=UPI001651C554|nr:aminotransferase class I/II-fold pyridoxal phosphate-dependent enzyme [Treponema sp. Marseille-Q3903]MBC6712509.1 aminotransferase class I/II-fold pyridoxal phosphate-dependent enzyme [Treponema sp. Marseille-Q3903]